jgi:uncharacterized membrane protein
MDILNYFGKFHPILLHLPIGFLLLAFMMEIHDRWRQSQQFETAINFALFWGMVGAIFAAGTGYLLSLEGGYDDDLLNWHQWSGIGVAGLSILVYYLHQRKTKTDNKSYFVFFSLLTIALIGTGHFGGSLTHGSDFLSPNAPSKSEKQTIVDLENAIVFTDLIQPILEDKCVRCHRPSKTKGDLLMTTIEGLQKGGESGALFVKGDVDNSLMLQRIHLALEEKEHMPPKGKQQLLTDEITLLTWWIQEGADFTAKVSAVNKDEKIKTILQKFITPSDDATNIEVPKVAESTLQKIRAAGIPIHRVAEDNPFVKVDLSIQKKITKNTLKKLKPVGKQLISLNLGATNIEDAHLAILSHFPHLQKLFLQQTQITDKGIAALENLDYLTYLNLYETKITDASLPQLSQLKRLKKLYLWQTATTKEGIAQFINQKPKTHVNTGVKNNIFGDAQLKSPVILAEKDLFKDSIEVALKMNFGQVDIYYTLDGTTPDTTASLYTEPIILDKTTNIKAIAHKKGWKTSEVVNRQLARVKYTPTSIRLNRPPNKKYKANGPNSLIDLEKGSTTFTDGLWIGYEKQHFTATMDLGKSVAVSSITVGALEAPGSYIFFPKGLQISVSNDGQQFRKIITKQYPTATENKPTTIANFSLEFATQTARYVRVKIESNLVNPDWHPAPGAPCWVFVDEISVE